MTFDFDETDQNVTKIRVTPFEMSKQNDNLNKAPWIGSPVRLLSLEGACKYLSCSNDLLEELIALGHIPVIRLGPEPGPGKRDRRKRWVDRLDLDAYIEDRKKFAHIGVSP